MTISAIVTYGVRSVGRLSFSGNRAREGYPDHGGRLSDDEGQAAHVRACRRAGAHDEGVAPGVQPAEGVQLHAQVVAVRLGAHAREGLARAADRDAHRRALAVAYAAGDAPSALLAADRDRAAGRARA